ncbi:MAG: dihydrofolate reductase family protein [Vicinamibacterales bacterium]
MVAHADGDPEHARGRQRDERDAEGRLLEDEAGPGMVILGSGSIVAQLAEAQLLDSFQVVINPLALGAGKTLFGGVTGKIGLTLTQTRTFKNGNVVLCYEPR